MGVTCERTSTRAENLNGAPVLISISATAGGATGWIWFSWMAWPSDRSTSSRATSSSTWRRYIRSSSARGHLARAEAGQLHATAQGVVSLVELRRDVGPGELELDLLLDRGQVFNRDLHGKRALSTLRAPPGASLTPRPIQGRYAISPCTPSGVSVSIGPSSWVSPVSRSLIAWGPSRPPVPLPGARAPGSRSPAAKGPSSAGAARPIRPIPPRRCAIPAARSSRASRTRERPCDRAGLRRHLDLEREGPARGVRHQPASRRAECAPAARGSWPRSRTSRSPAWSRAARAPRVFTKRRAAPGRRARDRARDAGAPLRPVRERLPQAEGPRRQLRHQRLQAEVDLERRRADPGLRQRPLERCRRAGCARPARPTSARSPTARSAAGRRAARRPGSGVAAISSTPAWPASRRPRRRTGCARAASASTRR